jgi:hypothetical protein
MAFKSNLGIQVDRPAEAITIVVSPGKAYWAVAGGAVLIRAIVGFVTVTFGGANTLSLVHDPTDAAAANSPLCGATDVGTTGTSGDIVAVAGAPATGLVAGHLAAQVLGVTMGFGIALGPGNIGLVATAAVGTMKWTLWYIPIDAGATVTNVAP